MKYKQPETLDECEARLANLTGEEVMILSQLGDTSRMQGMDAFEYQQWKSATIGRKAFVIRERKLLEAWRASEYRRRADEIRAQKAERLRVAQELQQQRIATASENITNELQLIRSLFGIVQFGRKRFGVELSDGAQAVVNEAEAYLIAKGLFD